MAWEKVAQKIATDPTELHRRLALRKRPCFRKPIRPWCLVIRASDRRIVSVSLTDKGKAGIQEAPELLQADFVSRFEKLPPWEQKMLIAALERVASLMDAEQVDASPILEVGELVDDAAST